MQNVYVNSSRLSPLRLLGQVTAEMTGDDNFIATTDSASSHGVLAVQSGSNFVLNNADVTLSLSDDSLYHVECVVSTMQLTGTVTVHGQSARIMSADTCTLSLRNFGLSADETNDASGYRIQATNTNFDIIDSDITLSNVSNGILVSGGKSIAIGGDTVLDVQVNDNSALLIGKASVITADSNTEMILQTLSTSDPCVVLNSASSIVMGGTSTLLANFSTCVQLNTKSSFVHDSSASTKLFCNVTELTFQDMSDGVYTSGSSATLLPGTADKTLIGADLHNTSDLIASLDTLFSDGTSGAGVQGCRLRVT